MARSCHRRRRCVVQFLLALDILSARIRNPCTKIYFSVINVHSFYDPRREYAKESVSMKLNQSSTVSRLFLGRLSGNEKREREMANIIDDGENFNGKILSWVPRNDRTYGRHMRIFHTAIHAPILRFCAFFCFPPPCLGRNRSSTKHVWIYHNSYEFFCSFFEWLQGLPRIIKSSSVAKIQRDRRKYLVRSSGGSLSRVLKGYIFRRNVSMV